MPDDARDEADSQPQQEWEIVDDSDTEEDEREAEARAQLEARQAAERDHLNRLHIKDVAHEKRSLIRRRTYMLVIAFACVVGAGQFLWFAIAEFRQQLQTRAITHVVVAIGLLVVSIRFFQRAHWYQLESKKSVIPEPQTQPDFSSLSDGSQFARNLEKIER